MNDALQLLQDRITTMWHATVAALPNLALATVSLLAFWYLARALDNVTVRLAERTGQPASVAQIFGRLVSWAVLVVGALFALTFVAPSMNAATLFSTLGIGGVAIGFAFKDIFQNLLAGLLLLISRPFRIGDRIVTGANEGVVEDIALRASRLRTDDNRIVLVPNSELFTGRVTVEGPGDRRRVALTVGVPVDATADVEALRSGLIAAVARTEGVLDNPAPLAILKTASDTQIQFEAQAWIDVQGGKGRTRVIDQMICSLRRQFTAIAVSAS